MNRRQFIKRSTMACAAVVMLPGHLPAQAEKAAAPASSGASGTVKLPDYAGKILHSDMNVQSGRKADANPNPQQNPQTFKFKFRVRSTIRDLP